jgi:hypothetical protein
VVGFTVDVAISGVKGEIPCESVGERAVVPIGLNMGLIGVIGLGREGGDPKVGDIVALRSRKTDFEITLTCNKEQLSYLGSQTISSSWGSSSSTSRSEASKNRNASRTTSSSVREVVSVIASSSGSLSFRNTRRSSLIAVSNCC